MLSAGKYFDRQESEDIMTTICRSDFELIIPDQAISEDGHSRGIATKARR